MENILVTGSAGFVGSHICEHILKATDYNVIGLDKLDRYSSLERVDEVIRANPQFKSRYRFVKADLRERDFYTKLSDAGIAKGEITTILNLAARKPRR